MFGGSIRDNIDPHKKFEDPEIWNVLEQLGMAEWIRGLTNGLLTEVSDNFTASHRQLINLSRVVLHKPPIVLLDEATNSLDASDEVCHF